VFADRKLQMVDLHRQYLRIKTEIDAAMQAVIDEGSFINGRQVKDFANQLGDFLHVPYVVPCGNGTDALQIALMGLDLKPGDEVIVPAFTYIAAVEVIALLGLRPVLVDVQEDTFNIDPTKIEQAISPRTRAVIAVHLFGQCCDMYSLIQIASRYNLAIIEDNAQSVGAVYTFPDQTTKMAGTMGVIGTTSFFPSKPLACYGDGGAMTTSDQALAERLRMIANHGQKQKYHHQLIGCNSRLDTLQAAILQVKLKYINTFTKARQEVARVYDEAFQNSEQIITPVRIGNSSHIFHQYTIRVRNGKRDSLLAYLTEKGIPSHIYYPLAVHEQDAFKDLVRIPYPIEQAMLLSRSVLSLPIHTEMTEEEQKYIIDTVLNYE